MVLSWGKWRLSQDRYEPTIKFENKIQLFLNFTFLNFVLGSNLSKVNSFPTTYVYYTRHQKSVHNRDTTGLHSAVFDVYNFLETVCNIYNCREAVCDSSLLKKSHISLLQLIENLFFKKKRGDST